MRGLANILAVLGLTASLALVGNAQNPPPAASPPAAPSETATPTSQASPTPNERLNDLLALIEGPNSPEVRRTIARELLLQNWPESTPRLVAVLSGTNGPARVAVAGALTELPQYLDPTYIDPLMSMLTDANVDVQTAAANALAAYRDHGVTPRLCAVAQDTQRARSHRLAAIRTLGMQPRREAIAGLAGMLADPDPAVTKAVLEALEQATGLDFHGNQAAAERWWNEHSALPLGEWQQQQIERLVSRNRELRRRTGELEWRLVRALESSYQRTPEGERVALLATYLADPSVPIQLLGLKLIQLHLAQGRALPADLPAEMRDQIRTLMHSPDGDVQSEAVRTVASFRDPQDAGRFLEMLAAAQRSQVTQALVNGLGYVGTAEAVAPLLDVLRRGDEACMTEAVAALGRLAERGLLDTDTRAPVVEALRATFEQTAPTQVALRERLLWAMGVLKDVQFAPALAAALDRGEALAVRQAALRAITALGEPKLADALMGAVADLDVGIRRSAAEALAVLGGNDQHVDALWARLAAGVEPDEATRQAATRACIDLLARRPATQIESRIATLPGNGPDDVARQLEFLGRLLAKVQETAPSARDRQGVITARMAALQAEAGQIDAALEQYRRALADLHASGSPAGARVAVQFLRLALISRRYDASVVEALATANPGVPPGVIWQTIATEIEMLLTPEKVEQALALLDAVEAAPPPGLSLADAATLRARALQIPPPPGLTTQPVAVPDDGGAAPPDG